MRIVYLHQYFRTPEMSGGTRSYEMGRRLVKAGHEVHVITARDAARGGARWDVRDVEGMHVHSLAVPYDNTMGAPRRIMAFIHFALIAGFRAGRVRPDLIFATSTPLTIVLPAAMARVMSRARIVFEVRDLWPEVLIALGALRHPVPRFAAHMLERFAYRISDQIVALSPGMADGVARTGFPRERIHVIPNSSDLDLFAVDDSVGAAWRSEHPELGAGPLAVYCGALGVANEVIWLVDVAERLPADSTLRIVVVGQGTSRQSIVDKASELGLLGTRLHVLNPVPKSEMPAVMNAAAISFSILGDHPALRASSPNKLFDAMAAGRPIAINYGGWLADLLRASGAGVILDRDPASAADELARLAESEESLTSMGRASRVLARDRFDRDLLAAELVEVIEQTRAP